MRINSLTLEGLRVTVAREHKDDDDEKAGANDERPEAGGTVAADQDKAGAEVREDQPEDKNEDKDESTDSACPGFVIETVYADGTHLEVLPKDAWKQPLAFDLFKLWTLHDAGPNSAMKFDSVMTNPKPPGDIVTNGEFGPWNKEEPRRTPVSGDYTFSNADLSVFKGIRNSSRKDLMRVFWSGLRSPRTDTRTFRRLEIRSISRRVTARSSMARAATPISNLSRRPFCNRRSLRGQGRRPA